MNMLGACSSENAGVSEQGTKQRNREYGTVAEWPKAPRC